ncbi:MULTISPECIES: phosphate ABC transporter substrate-binding protein [Halomonadaceae]|jgi:ABC-type phosphate transport system substrate-binding protein|uniref:Phosphate ABC transporter substrate-binding protein n=1 Tax=Vreelandella piezotolerans TaxID=2609667 RepID=A0ABQ6XB32_9GAMM|nr:MULTISPECIES: phosphate ABC transporter substrate-binding protein [Halomonas]KAE8439214.1 phosphate ABC transporter substrate-binding protein [Halomonas piezotolerans]MCG7575533.1 phosphate ABC transporter substrate-binding protein [Halomonas sp. MMH1-48]MCG7589022.1 phosphate ABC transporter substrate-binding protein [Halomonas sp. McD50-5]MCG7602595.1 phosphate ABC transporter substrate-binding protein [Halomonas sp. MM17-34]MCG7611647.1 phosphate ABC transporter substrate-binding protein|tara:strand:- start:580 stop:1005 length:426 start_codon:yes stop_codon:yes gene_type:complete
MAKRLSQACCCLLLGLLPCAGVADLVVVVSAETGLTRIQRQELKDLYLDSRTRLQGGAAITPIDQSERSRERDEFYRRYIEKTPAQLRAHWARLIFTGRGQPPQTLADSQAVVERLARDPGALGYIDARYLDDRLRVVTIE